MSTRLPELVEALSAVPGLEAMDCDGEGHPIPDPVACVHVRCTLSSPDREMLLGKVGPLIRRSRFVMAALVDRADLYAISYAPDKRRPDPEPAIEKLLGLLADPAELASDHVPDRRGR
ncbi:MAG: hypothetical protein AAF533_08170 [Acidobacteriota bacterium]